MQLNYDLLILTLEALEEAEYHYYPTLFACSLVNRVFNEVASRSLYRKVVLEPQPTYVLKLGLRDQELVHHIVFIIGVLPYQSLHLT